MKRLTHIDKKGKAAMVDVSGKERVKRTALASGFIQLSPSTVTLIKRNAIEKGDHGDNNETPIKYGFNGIDVYA